MRSVQPRREAARSVLARLQKLSSRSGHADAFRHRRGRTTCNIGGTPSPRMTIRLAFHHGAAAATSARLFSSAATMAAATSPPPKEKSSFPFFTATAVGVVVAAALLVGTDTGRTSDLYCAIVDNISVPLMIQILDPETAHNLTVSLMAMNLAPKENASSTDDRTIMVGAYYKHPLLPKDAKLLPIRRRGASSLTSDGAKYRKLELAAGGINVLGMAAGFDKNAEVFSQLFETGFGLVEVGGVTPLPQPGNEKPRCFRLPADGAVINRYGLNSQGHESVVPRLSKNAARSAAGCSGDHADEGREENKKSTFLGVNLAKNTATEGLAATIEDYRKGVRALGPYVDYLCVNVSCPNVKWTKDLKQTDIANLVSAVVEERDKHATAGHGGMIGRRSKSPPLVFLKIGPDYYDNEQQLSDLMTLAKTANIDGLVISNTSSVRDYDEVKLESDESLKSERGGLSGKPIKEKALKTCRKCYQLTNGEIPIIGVGGISTGAEAYERIRNGACLLQIYTAMIYNGPGVVRRIKKELISLLEEDGFKNVWDAVGVDC